MLHTAMRHSPFSLLGAYYITYNAMPPKYAMRHSPFSLLYYLQRHAAKIDHLAKTIIAAFHKVMLSDVLPPDSADRVSPTISQVALPAIMRDEVLSPYKFFMYDCTSSDHGRSFCLGTVPNSFRSVKVLMRTTHPKLLTTPKSAKEQEKETEG
uniref:Uncharacterized protein n=1 Tax=Romanomermis culicivorax TaxID=13658 RepID=A0A915IXL8_ROMCU